MTFSSPIWRSRFAFERITKTSQKGHQQNCQVPIHLYQYIYIYTQNMCNTYFWKYPICSAQCKLTTTQRPSFSDVDRSSSSTKALGWCAARHGGSRNQWVDWRPYHAGCGYAGRPFIAFFFLCKRGFQNYFSTARAVVWFFPCFPWSRALSHKFRKRARKSAAKTEQSVPSRKFP